MESVVKANGVTKAIEFSKSLLISNNGVHTDKRITVQQALCKWYSFFNKGVNLDDSNGGLFPEVQDDNLYCSLKTDVELIPSVLMDEFVSNHFIVNKEQYIRLVQALLINLSDCLLLKHDKCIPICSEIEHTLYFIQNFFYREFDRDARVSNFHLREFRGCAKLKLEYWQIKLNDSALITLLKDCFVVSEIQPESETTYRKIAYLKYLLQQIETVTTILNEDYLRELLTSNNFNADCFINYEIGLLRTAIAKSPGSEETISFLECEQLRISQLKTKPGISYDSKQPSLKKQLFNWIAEEIRQVELKEKKMNDDGLPIDPGLKIQTTLSVAKLAVLIRLMVVDKIIINQPIAPALRTAARIFTTLQKDEIAFGSLETKYHAPDKNTIAVIKEMLQKWIVILGKL